MPGKRRRPRNYRTPLSLTLTAAAALTTTAAVLRSTPKITTPPAVAAVMLPDVMPTPSRFYPRPTGKHHRPVVRRSAPVVSRESRPARAFHAVATSRPSFTAIQWSPKRERVIEAAKTQLGDPYLWGGTGPDAWDCSGIIQWAFAQVGIAMPRVSGDQAAMGRVTRVSDLHAGDLVAWSGHIALWLGNGQILEAQRPGTTVHIRTFGSQGGWDDSAWGVSLDYSELPRL